MDKVLHLVHGGLFLQVLWFEGKLLARRIRLLLHSAKLNIILLVQLR